MVRKGWLVRRLMWGLMNLKTDNLREVCMRNSWNILSSGNTVSPLVVVLSLGLLVRLVILFATQDLELKIVDEQHYVQLALNLLHGNGFAFEAGHLTSLRPPLYPAFLAFIWWVAGTDSLLIIRIAQVGLSLFNSVLVYWLGLRLFNQRVALYAAAGFCFYPSLLGFNAFLLTETLFVVLFTLFILGYVVLVQTGKISVALGVGSVLGLAALTRSILWPFPVILCFLAWFALAGNRAEKLKLIGVLLLGFVVVIGPWVYRNTQLQGVFTVVATQGGITLLMGNSASTPLYRAWDPITLQGEQSIFNDLPEKYVDGSRWTEGKKEKWAQKNALTYMMKHPWLTFQRSVVKFANFWGLERVIIAGWQQGLYSPLPIISFSGAVLISLAWVGLMLVASLGVFLSPPPNFHLHLFLITLLLFISGMHTLVFGHSRYHLALIPILCLYGAAAIQMKAWERLGEKTWCARGAITSLVILFSIWMWEVLFMEVGRIKLFFEAILS